MNFKVLISCAAFIPALAFAQMPVPLLDSGSKTRTEFSVEGLRSTELETLLFCGPSFKFDDKSAKSIMQRSNMKDVGGGYFVPTEKTPKIFGDEVVGAAINKTQFGFSVSAFMKTLNDAALAKKVGAKASEEEDFDAKVFEKKSAPKKTLTLTAEVFDENGEPQSHLILGGSKVTFKSFVNCEIEK